MRITVERLPSKKGWVAYPASAGRPVKTPVTNVSKTTRAHAVQAPTKLEAVQGVLASVGFKPTRLKG